MRKVTIIIIMMLSGCSIFAQQKEQPSDSTVVVDSVQENNTVEEPVTENDSKQYSQYDTSLYDLQLNISHDSINALKNQPAYAYNRYLDSLLKIRKHKEDSIRMEMNKGQSSKSSSSQSEDNITMPEENDFFASGITKIILWSLAGAFVLFILYKLFLGDGMFKKAPRKTAAAEAEEEEAVTDQTDIDALIATAVKNSNYRLAVRYWYLKSLHHLSGKGLLYLAQDKTNYQYVNELTNPVFRNDFAALTLNYEYVWYGEFDVDNTLYYKLENIFSSFIKKV
ncbi:MAG: hypothetical protein ABJA78_05095 [Ferruginibacter sp.]